MAVIVANLVLIDCAGHCGIELSVSVVFHLHNVNTSFADLSSTISTFMGLRSHTNWPCLVNLAQGFRIHNLLTSANKLICYYRKNIYLQSKRAIIIILPCDLGAHECLCHLVLLGYCVPSDSRWNVSCMCTFMSGCGVFQPNLVLLSINITCNDLPFHP